MYEQEEGLVNKKKQDMHTYTYNEILTTKTARLKC